MNIPNMPRRSSVSIGFLVLLSVIYACFSINFSYEYGRLSTVIGYDDIVYFDDGLTRLRIFYENGIFDLLLNLVRNPPHSPFSTLLAAAAFAIFGIRDWAPYIANASVIFAMLLLVRHITRSMSLYAQVVLLFFALAPYFVMATVLEFRPDLPAGLFGAIAVFLAVTRPIAETRFRDRLFLSCIFALALMTKPTASLFVVVMMLASLGFSVYRSCSAPRNATLLFATLLAVQCLVMSIILVLPYYYANWGHLTRYVSSATGSDIWVYSRDWEVKLWMYLTGVYGRQLLGGFLYVYAAAIVLFGGMFMFYRKKDSTKVLGGLVVMVLMAWFAPTYLGMGNPFFAATFYYLFLFTVIYGFVEVFESVVGTKSTRFYAYAFGMIAIVFVLALSYATIQVSSPRSRPTHSDDSVKVSQDIFQALEADIAVKADKPVTIYYTATGYVNNDLFTYYFKKRNKKIGLRGLFTFDADEQEWVRLLEMSDYIVACDPGTGGVANESFPSGKLLDKSMALVRSRSDFVEIKSVKMSTGSSYYLFKRIDKAAAVQG
ncbi:glycosyltransferase family 39 protein [Acidovorax sp. Leaf73]|uniref:glycosyltransferase family 39 protein n=1 Tax=Acidovorax sp. Leaf73 TaxID=2876566 RepID=UPI001E5A17C8|nr:glycosyltransferase family 39 protein [Acidovorax sp. Leaf73]